MAQNDSYFNFTDKVAIVTGGSTGIGRATSLLFARHGAKVVIGDVNPEGRETVSIINREGGDALFVETDVRNARQVEDLVTTAVETYGGLHFAFNNAGILPEQLCSPTWTKQRSIKLSPSPPNTGTNQRGFRCVKFAQWPGYDGDCAVRISVSLNQERPRISHPIKPKQPKQRRNN